jgi:hypothetical protein
MLHHGFRKGRFTRARGTDYSDELAPLFRQGI